MYNLNLNKEKFPLHFCQTVPRSTVVKKRNERLSFLISRARRSVAKEKYCKLIKNDETTNSMPLFVRFQLARIFHSGLAHVIKPIFFYFVLRGTSCELQKTHTSAGIEFVHDSMQWLRNRG